jgi:hypothetical protein
MITHWIDDRFRFIPPAPSDQAVGAIPEINFAICAAAAAIGLAILPAQGTEKLKSAQRPRASVARFYKSLNAEFAGERAPT